jgi:hypothetical protein
MAEAKPRKAPAGKKTAASARKTTKAKAASTAKSTTAKKAPAAKRSAAKKTTAKKASKARRVSAVDRTSEVSEEVLKSLQSGQRAAIDAVRKFVDTVDEMLPSLGERPKKREEVVDAAMEMADKLVRSQYEFLRSVVQSASKVIDGPRDGK